MLSPVQVRGRRPAGVRPAAGCLVEQVHGAPGGYAQVGSDRFPQTVIQDRAATSLQDVLRNSPGIPRCLGAGEGGQPLADRPFIRGASSGNNIFVDGIRDPGGQTREIFNVESVEIIRGADSASGRPRVGRRQHQLW